MTERCFPSQLVQPTVAASARHENSATHPNGHLGITAVQGTGKLPANTDRKSNFQSLSLVQAAF